jgi:signal transduction histidine kinase
VLIPETSLVETLVILLRNAAEAMEGRGRGRVEVDLRDGGVVLCIHDEGAGFSGTDLSEVFKPGFTTKEQGSGYGLFLAKRLAEEHGGTLEARDRSEGGATIELWLPGQSDGSDD